MARRGSRKDLSIRHEEAVASSYDGLRSRSSGGHVTDSGDVRVVTDRTLFECKGKFGTLIGQSPVTSTLLKQFEKVADEAYEDNLEPALALRFYVPKSALADKDGYVDLAVRLLDDDASRSYTLQKRKRKPCVTEGRWR